MKVIEQDPALAAAGSRLTCVVGMSAGILRRIWFQSTRFKCPIAGRGRVAAARTPSQTGAVTPPVYKGSSKDKDETRRGLIPQGRGRSLGSQGLSEGRVEPIHAALHDVGVEVSLDHPPRPGEIGHGAEEPGQLPAHRGIRNGPGDEYRGWGGRRGGPALPGGARRTSASGRGTRDHHAERGVPDPPGCFPPGCFPPGQVPGTVMRQAARRGVRPRGQARVLPVTSQTGAPTITCVSAAGQWSQPSWGPETIRPRNSWPTARIGTGS